MGKLTASVRANADELKGSANRSISVTALLARNLLELLIWIEYCRTSEDRSLQFLLDFNRDFIDLISTVLAKVPEVSSSPEWQGQARPLATLMQDSLFALGEPISYTSILDAAKSIDVLLAFQALNKTLSKFAHPTAFSVLAGSQIEAEPLKSSLINMLVDLGVGFANKAFAAFDSFSKDPDAARSEPVTLY